MIWVERVTRRISIFIVVFVPNASSGILFVDVVNMIDGFTMFRVSEFSKVTSLSRFVVAMKSATMVVLFTVMV